MLNYFFEHILYLSLQIFYCAWIFFEFVYCFIFVVETKGLSLEETAALFEMNEGTRKARSGSPFVDEEFGGAVLVAKQSEAEDRSVYSDSTGHTTLKPDDTYKES